LMRISGAISTRTCGITRVVAAGETRCDFRKENGEEENEIHFAT